MIDQLRNTTNPAGSEICRDKEQPQTHRLYQAGEDDQQIVTNGWPVFFHGQSLWMFDQNNSSPAQASDHGCMGELLYIIERCLFTDPGMEGQPPEFPPSAAP